MCEKEYQPRLSNQSSCSSDCSFIEFDRGDDVEVEEEEDDEDHSEDDDDDDDFDDSTSSSLSSSSAPEDITDSAACNSALCSVVERFYPESDETAEERLKRDGCQMSIATFLDRMRLALGGQWTMALLRCATKLDPFLFLKRAKGGSAILLCVDIWQPC